MYIGFDIGGTKCAVTLADTAGNIQKKIRFDTTTAAETQEKLLLAAEELARGQRVIAAGISCGSPLDSEKGVILSPPNLPGWDRVPITEMVTKRLGVPAFLCNDANACALAEWKYGAGQGTRHMIFLTFGTGFGAGLILDGRLYEGRDGMAGEIGHVGLSEQGPVGYGREGAAEGYCSGGGIAQIGQTLARAAIQKGTPASFCPTLADLPAITARSVAEAADGGDEVAREVYRISGRRLGQALGILIDLFNPECIVIGSVFKRAEHLLRPAMEESLGKYGIAASVAGCRILPAVHDGDLGDLAAIAIAAMNAEKNGLV